MAETDEKPAYEGPRIPSSRELQSGLRQLDREIELSRKPVAAPAPTPEQTLDPVLGIERVIRTRSEPVTPAQDASELPSELGITARRNRILRAQRRDVQPEQEPPTIMPRRSRIPEFGDPK